MKYIVALILVISFYSSIPSLAQENAKPSQLIVSGSGVYNAPDPLFIISEGESMKEITPEELGKISTNDIQSVSVLKDPQALLVYGEKARNGVVVLVMKDKSFLENFPDQTQPDREGK